RRAPLPALLAYIEDRQERQRQQGEQDVGVRKAHGDDWVAGRVPSVTCSVWVLLFRDTTTETWSPGFFPEISVESCVGSVIRVPPIDLMTSPCWMPALNAGPPRSTVPIWAPEPP